MRTTRLQGFRGSHTELAWQFGLFALRYSDHVGMTTSKVFTSPENVFFGDKKTKTLRMTQTRILFWF